MSTLGGWQGMDWRAKVIVKSCGGALVKPKNQRRDCAGSLTAEIK